MIIIDNTSLSDDLFLVNFSCHLEKCHGACCVKGESGAPLELDEISQLEDLLEKIKPFMSETGFKTIENTGVFICTEPGKFVTPLTNSGECAFANFHGKLAYCAIEKAYEKGHISFQKPVSCHLYPLRITDYESFKAVNYHKWHICRAALKKGKMDKVPLHRFLKPALVRKYGTDWYEELEKEIKSR
jgi:hypothetical protein